MKKDSLTHIRKEILESIIDSNYPITARDVMNTLTSKGVDFHRTTVYRDLFYLEKNGFINSYTFKDQSVIFYEYADGDDHHHHVICDECGKIEKIYPKAIEKEIDKYEKVLLTEKGYKIGTHRLKFYGLCNDCR